MLRKVKMISCGILIFLIASLYIGCLCENDDQIPELIVSYETSETSLEITSPDYGVSLQKMLGGNDFAPPATEGRYVLKMDWIDETDRKVEIKNSGLNFDLSGEKPLLIDVYIKRKSGIDISPKIVGIWNDEFQWIQATTIPPHFDEWFTLEFDVSQKIYAGIDHITIVFENMETDEGTIYIDNIRLGYEKRKPRIPYGLTAAPHDSRIDLRWKEVSHPELEGYNIYRSESVFCPFKKINSFVDTATVYSDFLGTNGKKYYYYVKAVSRAGVESLPSSIVSATSYEMDEDQLLTSVQDATFRYFWDGGHPVSGMAREGYRSSHGRDVCATGGTGFGLMTIIVGAERGFVSRAEAAERILKILTFLEEKTTRYFGAWGHWINGATGETIPFGPKDDGADLVETSFLIQGMLVVRQFFNSPNDPVELEIREGITRMWESVQWDWFLGYNTDECRPYLHWHWSPTYGFGTTIGGFNEAMIAYLLAIASPTHPIEAVNYYNGWTGWEGYPNCNTFYGYRQWVAEYGKPLFWTHYSYLGFDPDWSDWYCNYYDNNRHYTLINRAYCIENPNGCADYDELVWGLTCSDSPWGYRCHYPNGEDNCTIAPTAALSAMPYTPEESIATLVHFYRFYGSDMWGPFGFFDAFNLNEDWFSNCYLAIDQGPIVPMIENYRTGLCWEMFMTNPEIDEMLHAINTVEFANKDIGDVSVCGSLETNNGEYTIQGSGWDMWEYWDECHFAYRRLSGNGQITARIESMDYTHEWAKAGVMIRESLSTDSKQAMMVMTPSNYASFQWRPNYPGIMFESTQFSDISLPHWIRLVREGDAFRAYHSPDGNSWTEQGDEQIIPMCEDVYIGLVVTSHNDGVLCKAKFNNITLTFTP